MGYSCPECGREFDTQNGMKTHHVYAHGESIAGELVECDWCGDEIRVTYSRAEQDHQFCGDECMGKWESEHESGENAHTYKGKVTVECSWCGETKEVFPCRVEDGKNHFCSKECQGKFFSETYSGEQSWHWKGGAEWSYGPNWGEQRLKARIRDQARCQCCGRTEPENIEQFGRVLLVHHLVPRRRFVEDGVYDYERGNRLENLITVCDICHHKIEKFTPLAPQ